MLNIYNPVQTQYNEPKLYISGHYLMCSKRGSIEIVCKLDDSQLKLADIKIG